MWVQGTHSVLKSPQIKMSETYIYYLNTAFLPSHDMTIIALWQLLHLAHQCTYYAHAKVNQLS